MSVAAVAPTPLMPAETGTTAAAGSAAPVHRSLRAVPTEPPEGAAPLLPLRVVSTEPPEHTAPLLPLRAVPTGPPFHAPVVPLPTPLAARPTKHPAARDNELSEIFGAQPTPRGQLPDPRPRAAAAVKVLLEVLVGDRPAYQAARWVSPGLLARLECRRPAHRTRQARRPLLRSLHVSEPAESVAEVAAVVSTGERCRAMALRLEGSDGRWTVTALRVG